MAMRKLTLLATVAGLAVPSALWAAPRTHLCPDPLAAQEADLAAAPKPAAGEPVPFPPPAPSHPVNCFRDEVLVLSGEGLVKCLTPTSPMDPQPNPNQCIIDPHEAAAAVAKFFADNPTVPRAVWDQLVIFASQTALRSRRLSVWNPTTMMMELEPITQANPPAPIFYREGFKADARGVPVIGTDGKPMLGANEVAGIGIKSGGVDHMQARPMGRPWLGYVAAGGVGIPGNPAASNYGSCANTVKGTCAPTVSSFFDALAQQTGALFGPYLALTGTQPMGGMGGTGGSGGTGGGAGPDGGVGPDGGAGAGGAAGTSGGPAPGPNDLSVRPLVKAGFFQPVVTGMMPDAGMGQPPPPMANDLLDELANPRVWNSFLDLKGSLMGGNSFRNSGNGTFETTQPDPNYGINVPYPAGWPVGTRFSGTGGTAPTVPRFMPLDLYVMGFIPPSDLENIPSFMSTRPDQVYRPTLTTGAFTNDLGPQMGWRTGVAIRTAAPGSVPIMGAMGLLAVNGTRAPAFATAPHHIRQLWVVFTKPDMFVNRTAAVPPATAEDRDRLVATNLRTVQVGHYNQISTVSVWRRLFNLYFYMRTGYRGRVVSTYEANWDDTLYWEFGAPLDDNMTFTKQGRIEFEIPSRDPTILKHQPCCERIPNSPEIKNVLRITRVTTETDAIRFNPKPLPIKINGSPSSKLPLNSITLRMRVPRAKGPNGEIDYGWKGYATVQFDNGPSFRIPSTCGQPAWREGCTDDGYLIPDGKWRHYAATLSKDPDFTGGEFSGFSILPSNVEYEAYDEIAKDKPDGIEIEFIRIANVPAPNDTDLFCVRCDKCSQFADAQTCQNAGCKSKAGHAKVTVPRPDGWIDSEDNCPKLYNPLQEDDNEDGIGDACEDFDGDGSLNACDNCPTTTNSRQLDKDGNDVGDVCDGATGGGCFLRPDSLAGSVPFVPSALVAGLLGVALSLLSLRRRRRR